MLDVSNDYLIFDWTEPISYFPRLTELTYLGPYFCNHALKREDLKKYILGDLQIELSQHQVIWEIWKADMSTVFIPKREDKFIRQLDSSVWVVEDVSYSDKSTRYRLTTYAYNQGV